ncbi:TIR domain-containing protein [Maribacter halichondriae]|uniref:TIR domain-containing protein n=1 Tax=Maribacter halichondriae TaxID=2980554 RepID=UPI002359C4B3|nr:TIR domain-containing protein [Maribacter sp. Hal144]
MDSTKNIYAIYASEDIEMVLPILHRLGPLEEDHNITLWHDDPIDSGQPWKPRDESRLNKADIFLLLVSNAFMHSEFIQQLEFKRVIDRYKEDGTIVIPIILDDCPWDIDFKSDDYNFNFKELQVLPEGAEPLSDWDSTEQAIKHIADRVKWVVAPSTKSSDQRQSNDNVAEQKTNGDTEDQLAIPFSEEQEAKIKAEQEIRIKEEAETKRKAEEDRKQREEVALKQKEQKEKRLKEQADAKKRADEEQRLKEETEAKKRAQEEHRLQQEAEAKNRAEENRLREEEARLRIETSLQAEHAAETNAAFEESGNGQKTNTKKRMLIGAVVALLAIFAVIAFSIFNSSTEEDITPLEENSAVEKSEDEVSEQNNALPSEEVEVETPSTEDAFSKLNIGDRHEGGIIFSMDSANKTGKIAHVDDAGPMPWQDAMIIHDQLGDGWRLPTLEELRLMYKNIGQGADNSGEFADGLYWSATDYDQYQARLLRFRDGNTSYHYNKEVESRRFLVRAVRDFSL